MAPVKDDRFLPEVWALYCVGVLWVVLRFAVRLRTLGLRGLQIDDGFAFFSVICWTVIIIGIHITYYTGTNVDYSAAEVWELTDNQVERASFGTKLYVVTLYAYIAMLFSFKAIVIILYQRLAFGNWQKKLLNLTIAICIIGFLTTTLMSSLICLPFKRRFRVRPLPAEKCTSSSMVFIVISCFNAFTDALLLTIPLPMLWTLRIPLLRRIGVFLLLASGIFVMAACITRVSLTVVPNATIRVIARWGVRELAVALVAVNSASLRPMFRKSFWSSERALAERRKSRPRNFHIRDSVRRVKKRFGDRLVSTSAGESTIQNFAAEDGTRHQSSIQQSGHQEVSQPTRVVQSSFGHSVIETLVYGQTRGRVERDLEKNETQLTTTSVVRTRSTSPNVKLENMSDTGRMPGEPEKTTTSSAAGRDLH